MTPTVALYARIAPSEMRPLLPVQERIRMRLLADEWAERFETLSRRDIERVLFYRNGQLFEPMHHHCVQRRGSQFANRKEVRL